ncbi:hypothetical protein K2Z84_22000 [Candidatus Binatia bacterium]|nr:hypothetical protein [Candidatus Binatia bacterium]
MSTAATSAAWAELRYGRLLPLAARRRAFAAQYERVVPLVESALDRERRAAASARMQRWLGVSPRAAATLYRSCLASEAREEADTAWFMAQPWERLAAAYRPLACPVPPRTPTIWTILHFGSPILAYVHLCRVWGVDARIIGRALDDANPMPSAKQAWGRRKVAWVQEVTGKPFLSVDAAAIAYAREHLLSGGALLAAIDVPGDVVGRSTKLTLFGEPTRVAAGIFRLAELTRVPLRSLRAISRGGRIEMAHGAPIVLAGGDDPLAPVARQVETILRAQPEEWWLWPYLPSFGA